MNRYERKDWRNEMRIKFDINYSMQPLNNKGFTRGDFDARAEEFAAAAQKVTQKRDQMKWRELPHNQAEVVEKIEAAAARIREEFEAFVVLGIGGSALGPIAVQQALNHPHYNELSAEKRGGPRFYVEDNIDPERMAALLDVIDVKKTMFNVISKSGGTSETMSQLLIITDLLHDALGEDISGHVIATTDKEKGHLIKIARMEGFETFVVPDGVGGRFSELCPVGLLAAAVCGIDIKELLAGAAFMDEIASEGDIWKNPAYMFGALQYLAMEQGMNISVMMPYADTLKYISDWYAQLWAESLGKKFALDGSVVHTGQTPVKALGVTDQHSQVQLYTEGPFDKVVTILAVEDFACTTPIPMGYASVPEVSFLGGHTQNELIQAEREATEYAILKSEHLCNTLTLPQVNAFTVGQLLYFFEVATAFAGELLGINTFDQPGVEEGKNATYALLGRAGFEEKRKELSAMPKKNKDYIL